MEGILSKVSNARSTFSSINQIEDWFTTICCLYIVWLWNPWVEYRVLLCYSVIFSTDTINTILVTVKKFRCSLDERVNNVEKSFASVMNIFFCSVWFDFLTSWQFSWSLINQYNDYILHYHLWLYRCNGQLWMSLTRYQAECRSNKFKMFHSCLWTTEIID